MPPLIIPLPTIVFQVLLLLVVVAIEAAIFHRYLGLAYKASAQYSLAINLFSSCCGWIGFFYLQPMLPDSLRWSIISLIFFNNLQKIPEYLSASVLVAVAFAGFVIVCFLEWQGILFLKLLTNVIPGEKFFSLTKVDRPSLASKTQMAAAVRKPNPLGTVLIVANGFSQISVIIILLILQLR